GDMVLIPRIKEETPYTFKLQKGRKRDEIELEFDEELAELFGWYLAEGCTSSQKGSYHVIFYLGKNEPENVERIKYIIERKLGLKVYVYEKRTSISVVIINKDLVHFLKDNFGENAKTKRIPEFILNSPRNVVRRFLYGYLKGDDNIDDYYIRFVTSSKILGYQLIILLAKLGIRSRIHKRKGRIGLIEGREVKVSESYEIFVSGTQSHSIHSVKHHINEKKNNFFLSDENFVYVPIRHVKKEKASLDVYNIETSSQTYALPFVVHNCSDKTGTLTKNEMTVRKIYAGGRIIDVTGEGYFAEGGFTEGGRELEGDDSIRLLLETGLYCNNASLGESTVGDPTEIALIVSARKFGINDLRETHKRLHEIHFDSDRKMMSVVYEAGSQKIMYTKGAVEEVLKRCKGVQKNGHVDIMTDKDRKIIQKTNEEFASSALRVLAFAYKKVSDGHEEKDLIFLGLQGMIDPPRPEVKDAIHQCRNAGIKVVMITGDHKNTAVAIAKELDLLGESRVLTGAELDAMDDKAFSDIVNDISVYARVSPEHKVRIAKALKKKGHVVAMTGDGINDAPALKHSDIGVSMGIAGTDVAKEASDMVLTDDNFATIVEAIKEGREIYDNIKKFVYYLLACNIGEVIAIFTAILIGFPLPLLPIQILWMNLITDGLPALALGVEPSEPGTMEKKPRKKNEKILNKGALLYIISTGIIMAAIMLGIFYYYMDNYPLAVTMAFSTLVFLQKPIAMSVRSRTPIHKIGYLKNRKMILALATVLILQVMVVNVPFFNPIFKTVPLGLNEWAVVAGVTLLFFAILEAEKMVRRPDRQK
ncbi:MAG: HAD-IC family P-type ATPase, partial [Candidatus Aenigmarchaeota archaeon]|nr:HAD-IC family P-type ATPase [Candidatus Aenigmarchaeota archaeon]MDI6722179.1 HAD-IC family P-type ATPase [Candidatus Aenigmarchaeota archaeon]